MALSSSSSSSSSTAISSSTIVLSTGVSLKSSTGVSTHSSSTGTNIGSESSSSGGVTIVPLLDGQYAFAGSDCSPNDACTCGSGTWTISTSSSSALTSDSSDDETFGVSANDLYVNGEMYGGWGSSPSLMLKTIFDEPLTIINASFATFTYIHHQGTSPSPHPLLTLF
jgi:hypothetical protein